MIEKLSQLLGLKPKAKAPTTPKDPENSTEQPGILFLRNYEKRMRENKVHLGQGQQGEEADLGCRVGPDGKVTCPTSPLVDGGLSSSVNLPADGGLSCPLSPSTSKKVNPSGVFTVGEELGCSVAPVTAVAKVTQKNAGEGKSDLAVETRRRPKYRSASIALAAKERKKIEAAEGRQLSSWPRAQYAEPIEIATGADYFAKLDELWKKNAKYVLIEFKLASCPPCRAIAGPLSNLSLQHPEVPFLIVDGRACSSVTQQCNVTAFPTFILVKKGKDRWDQVERRVGASLDPLIRVLRSLQH